MKLYQNRVSGQYIDLKIPKKSENAPQKKGKVRRNQQYDKYNNEKALANTHQDKIRSVQSKKTIYRS
jgi:hypothetical protein